MERYLKALVGAASDRAALVPYGRTYEGRTLYYLVISSPENLQRREEIRQQNLQFADPRQSTSDQANELVPRLPAIVWLAFGIHGNETSSTEAALLTAFHLLADRRPATRDWLNNVLVIIDPLQNADGHERFVSVYRETRGVFAEAQPLATEHQERWPGGRFNHYLFDMNRDWFLQSQRESQGRVAAYLRWQPHLLIDAHEMGYDATYFFDPPADPVNPLVLPQQNRWMERFGQQLGARYDQLGFAYTTREMFDAFYPGYGSTWPLFQGGVGILWEQAGVRGAVIQREDEQLLRLSDAVRHHYTSALVTLETAAKNREQLVRDFREARQRNIQLGTEGLVRDYFLPATGQAQRAEKLADLLRDNGVEVRRLTKPLVATCTAVRTGEKKRCTIPAGSFHIPVAQPAGALVRTLLDRHVDLGEEFIKRQVQRNDERFPDEIYDVTAWSAPLAFGVECLWTGATADITSSLWNGTATAGQVSGGKAQVAYLVADQDAAPRALASWLRRGLRVHVADREFVMGERVFPPGSLIVRTQGNPTDLPALMTQSARDFGLQLVAANSSMVTEGAHWGGPYVRWVRPPKVLLLMDRPASYTVGHTWHLFDQVLKYPVTRVAFSNVSKLDLSRYNVLVLPDGEYSGSLAPTENDIQRIREWASQGGTLILLKGAAAWATGDKVKLLSVKLRKKPAPPSGETEAEKPSGENSAASVGESPDASPGAFFRTRLFAEHWLTFGQEKTLDVFYTGNILLPPPAPAKGRSIATFLPAKEVTTSGFCWPQTVELLADSSYLLYEPLDKGHVIAFADDPNYRAMYPATQRLFVNAVLFGPGH
jgi:hypothetical protein